MTVISARLFLPVGLLILVPLTLAGCGNAGSGSALKNSAHLTPPPLQETKQTALIGVGKPSGDLTKKPMLASKKSVLASKKPKLASITPVIEPGAKKTVGSTKPIITAKNVNTPPMPVRRPYVKVRKKMATRMIKDQKPIAKIVKKASTEPAVTTPVVVEVPKVEMVPGKAVPVQVSSNEAPDMILDGFIDGSGINSSHQMSAQKLNAAKMAQAQTVAEKPDFGQSEFRFSAQK